MSTLSEIKQKFAVSKNAALRIQYLLKQEEYQSLRLLHAIP